MHTLLEWCTLKRCYLSSECWQMVFSSPCKVFVPKPRIFNIAGDICGNYFIVKCCRKEKKKHSKMLWFRQELVLTSNCCCYWWTREQLKKMCKGKGRYEGRKKINPNLLVWDPSFSSSQLNVSLHQTAKIFLQNGLHFWRCAPLSVDSWRRRVIS